MLLMSRLVGRTHTAFLKRLIGIWDRGVELSRMGRQLASPIEGEVLRAQLAMDES